MKKRVLVILGIIITVIVIATIVLWDTNKASAKDEKKYKILVDVESSKLFLFEDNIVKKEYICSGGKESTPSPIGTWSIISKGKWGEGFGGSWMGFDVPWGKFGIHGNKNIGTVGWASSHGCIRMKNEEAAELYAMIPIGTKVTIVDGPYGVFGKGFRNLKSGMYGSDVKVIQEKLKELGFFCGYANGIYGAATEEAVKAYCKANQLPIQKKINPKLQEQMGFELMD